MESLSTDRRKGVVVRFCEKAGELAVVRRHRPLHPRLGRWLYQGEIKIGLCKLSKKMQNQQYRGLTTVTSAWNQSANRDQTRIS